jgi:hypothetical protein
MIDDLDDAAKEARRKERLARTMERAQERAAAKARAAILVPHVGLAAYFETRVGADASRAERIANLLVDPRWPWMPSLASRSGVDKRDDRRPVRVGGRRGTGALLDLVASEATSQLYMNHTRAEGDFATVALDLDPRNGKRGDAYELLVTCRSDALPPEHSFEDFLTLVHDLIVTTGARHATLGAWPSFEMARSDTWLTRFILDTPKGEINLGLPADFDEQMNLLSKWKHKVGRVYARHPRWGTYLHAGHVAAIGGVERIRAEVEPARIEAVGKLTYIQLTGSIETALTAEAGAKRRALQALMAPILVGAPVAAP